MLIVLGSVLARHDTLEEARRLSTAHVERSRQEPGCISHAVYEAPDRPNQLVFVEEWDSEQALLQHFAVPASQQFVNDLGRLSAARSRIRIYKADELPFPPKAP